MRRSICIVLVMAACAAACSPAQKRSLPNLPVAQEKTANCMVSSMSALPEVTHARLSMADNPHAHVFITYDYPHTHKAFSPEVAHETLDITDLISGKQTNLALGGVSPGVSGQTDTKQGQDDMLDDADAGMFRIVQLWERKCGLTLSVSTD